MPVWRWCRSPLIVEDDETLDKIDPDVPKRRPEKRVYGPRPEAVRRKISRTMKVISGNAVSSVSNLHSVAQPSRLVVGVGEADGRSQQTSKASAPEPHHPLSNGSRYQGKQASTFPSTSHHLSLYANAMAATLPGREEH